MRDSPYRFWWVTRPRRETWTPSNLLDSELSHIGWGAFLSLATSLLAGPWWAVGIWTTVAAAKEIWDTVGLEGDPWSGSLLDFAMYEVGIGIGWATWWIATIGVKS